MSDNVKAPPVAKKSPAKKSPAKKSPAKKSPAEKAPEVKEKFTHVNMPGTDTKVPVTRVKDMGKAMHYYYTDPRDRKEKRIIRLKPVPYRAPSPTE